MGEGVEIAQSLYVLRYGEEQVGQEKSRKEGVRAIVTKVIG